MIYTDGIHLITDGAIDELHRFAAGLGLKREWFQDGKRPHYDLTTTRMAIKAVAQGAEHISPKEIINIFKGNEADSWDFCDGLGN